MNLKLCTLILVIIVLTACTSNESIQVSFCPHNNCSEIVAQQLNQANEIYCAVYDVDQPDIIKAIDQAYKNNKTIKFVVDNQFGQALFDYPFTKIDPKSTQMHNKFCILDNKTVITGSMNFATTETTLNNNNLIIINSSALAQNYLTEFNELYGGKFSGGNKTTQTKFLINNTVVENYFCPEDQCETKVITALKKAKTSIHFMVFSFTSRPIALELLLAKNRSVQIRGIFEERQDKFTNCDLLQFQEINVTKFHGVLLHHKVFIIDNQTVIAGSYNPTNNGNKHNDENILIIHNKEIATQFLEEYSRVAANSS